MFINNDCQPYIRLFQSEHQHINDSLQQVSAELEKLQAGAIEQGKQEAMIELLTNLRCKLWNHFSQEEEGGVWMKPYHGVQVSVLRQTLSSTNIPNSLPNWML